jgi:hypothetical protein
VAYKQKMLERLTGNDAISARQLSLETGLRQQTLSRWLQEACSLSVMPSKRRSKEWSIDNQQVFDLRERQDDGVRVSVLQVPERFVRLRRCADQ